VRNKHGPSLPTGGEFGDREKSLAEECADAIREYREDLRGAEVHLPGHLDGDGAGGGPGPAAAG
jgi:hypothetical protein